MESCGRRKSSYLRVHVFIQLRANVDATQLCQIVFRQWEWIDIFFIYPTFHREPVTCGGRRCWAD